MDRWRRLVALFALVGVVAAACAPSAPRQASGGSTPDQPRALKRINAAILGEPFTLSQSINTAGSGSIRGVGEVEKLVHAGASIVDSDGKLRPQLAEDVASVENGRWKVLPDGRMETTWTLRADARWHDGAPVTSQDLEFSIRAGSDKDIAFNSYPGYKSIGSVEVVDPRTITVKWKQPFIDADKLFTASFLMPLPKHLLEKSYLEQKASLLEQPYWSTAFIGAGPFRVKEFVRGSHMVISAFDGYPLGRPKLDEITIRFIQDPNTLVANLLAGEVDLTVGRGLNLEQALQTAKQWSDGRAESKPANWIAHYPQLLTPNPAVLGEAQFRRGLLMSLDRQELSDVLQSGQAPIAHVYVEPTNPFYKEVEKDIVKYDFNPRQAAQLFEGLGLAKGADGLYADASGQKIVIESRTNAGDDLKEKMVLSGADYWKRNGVDVKTFIVPRQQASDREFRATFPGFDLVRQPFDPQRWLGAEAALPANNFDGQNRTRYQNPELDAAIQGWFTTIPVPGRTEALRKMLRIMSDQVLALGVFYAPEPMLIANKLVNVNVARAPDGDETWNGHQWDVR